MSRNSIITIGLSPTWDITCKGRNIRWGLHQEIDEQIILPAGKALNVSKALAWMGQRSIAAGLWGNGDIEQMQTAVKYLWPSIRIKMTAVAAPTRRNITVIDLAKHKELHMRSRNLLVTAKTLKKLKADLKEIIKKNSICVFAGTLPDDGLLDDVIRVMAFCKSLGAKIVLDTSGRPLKELVDTGLVWMIKPNVEELRELLGEQIKDGPVSLAKTGRKLLDKVEIILISRGSKGGLVVTQNSTWQGRCTSRVKVLSTVGCGDFLLAGFLNDSSIMDIGLKTALKVATAKAWNWIDKKSWVDVKNNINILVERI